MTEPTQAPRVTLVTPAYNQGDYLAATIDSVLAQSLGALEYLVLDDGSTDITAAVLRGYTGRVSWETQPNMGQSETLNKGWSRARGEVLGYISSDDLLLPEAAAEAARLLDAHPDVVAVYCDFELIDGAGRRIRGVETQPYSERRMIEDLICFPGPGAFFRRAAFVQTGGWRAQFRQVPDFDFWLRLSRHGRFMRLPKVLAQYRIHDGAASFRVVSEQRSGEIIAVTESLWQEQGERLRAAGYSQARSLAMAHLLSARSHFVSARFDRGIAAVLTAWRLAPARMLQSLSWRILIGGLLRRPIYLLRALFKRRTP